MAGTDLNDFRSTNKRRLGRGTGYNNSTRNSPFPGAYVVEYVPYSESYGIQRAYAVQQVHGNYPTVVRTYEESVGGWSSWKTNLITVGNEGDVIGTAENDVMGLNFNHSSGKILQLKFYPNSSTLYAAYNDGTGWKPQVLLADFNGK